MKRILSLILAFLGTALLIGTGILAFAGRNMPVMLPSVPAEAQEAAEAFAEEINAGDLESLEKRIYGAPELEGEFENPVLTLLWQAYTQSFSWTFSGDWYATDSGICRTGQVTALDIPAILPEVESIYQELLPQRAQETQAELVYGEDGGYEPDFVLAVLAEATRQVLEKEPQQVQRQLTLTMIYADGDWYVQPDGALLELFSGELSGKEG